MNLFGKKQDKNDPVPPGVKLIGKIPEDEPIVIDRLSEEIIRQDITAIRDTIKRINEKLQIAVGNAEYLTDVAELVARFGKAYENLIVKINASSERQEANQREIINLLKTSNQPNKQSEKETASSQSNSTDSSYTSQTAESNKSTSVGESQPDKSDSQANEYASQNDNQKGTDETAGLANSANEDSENPSSTETDANHPSTNDIDPNMKADAILSTIKNTIGLIKDDYPKLDLAVHERNAENLRGMQISNLWFIALPPKTDGTYDPQNLQQDSFLKIKNSFSKNDGLIIIAVYDGDIKSKHIGGAKSSATDLKFNLTSRNNLGETLGLLKIKYNGQIFIKE